MSIKVKPPDDFFKGIKLSLKITRLEIGKP